MMITAEMKELTRIRVDYKKKNTYNEDTRIRVKSVGVVVVKRCFLFGHRDSPFEIQSSIEEAIERHYQQYGVRQFFVGSYGSFDSMAASALKTVKKHHTDMELYLLIPYHPAERSTGVPEGFDNTFYPPLERVPRRYAIVKANRYMVETCDTIICCASHFGNTRNLLDYAWKRREKGLLIVENLGQLW